MDTTAGARPMTTQEALALWQKEKELRVAADVLEAVLIAAAAQEADGARLADLTEQIAVAERALAEIRTTAERENRERRERTDAARSTLERAETDARTRAQVVERDLAQRLTAMRTQSTADVAAVARETEKAIADLRAEQERERILLSEIKAQAGEFRRQMASFVAPFVAAPRP